LEPERDPDPENPTTEEVPGKCVACGATNPEDAENCRNCGEPLWEESDDDEAAADAKAAGGLGEWRGLIAIAGVFALAIAAWMLWAPSGAKTTEAPAAAPAGAETSSAPQRPENEVKEIEVAGDVVWIGTSKGVFAHDRKSGDTTLSLGASAGLPHEFVDAILVDRAGHTWIGCFGGGVSVYDGGKWTHHEPAKTGSKTVVYAFQDRAGVYWFATGGAGLFRFDGREWTQYDTKSGLPNDDVNVVEQDRDGSLWVGSNGGVSHFKDGTWKTYRVADGLVNDKVLAVLIDRDGAKWFGTWGGGLSRFDGTSWKAVPGPADGPRSPFVLSGRVDSHGRLWFGTHDGVSMKDGETWSHYTSGDGLLGSDVYALEIDGDGNKWFGTYKGLSRLGADNKEWKTFLH
jgi:ligand-binding sensor domain-containing protein